VPNMMSDCCDTTYSVAVAVRYGMYGQHEQSRVGLSVGQNT
jgi:hypothetical protein